MIFKCKMCGGDIEPIENTNTGKCLYCKSVMTLPNLENEKIVNLYNRANDLRISNEFDKAKEVYENILSIDNEQIEAHWGLLLCKYGIEYVDDPKTKKKVPTCHRTCDYSILTDSDYKVVKKKSYGDALKLYEEEAKAIDEIQKNILSISTKEEPYDVFICYKETDKEGERTHDSVIAEDIYDKLVENGYKVFFARITLEDKLGTEYEPYIYSALKSSKVMLVVGTDVDNFNAVWVKNEWSRFLEMMKSDRRKTLIPVYSKIDAYKLPEEFAMLQAQSMDKVGAIQDLTRGIKKIIDENKNKKADNIDEETIEKVQKALGDARSIGNGNYEVTVVKEKLPTWYSSLCIVTMVFYLVYKFSINISVYPVSLLTFEQIPTKGYLAIYLFEFIYSFMLIIYVLCLLLNRKSHRFAKKIFPILLFISFMRIGLLFNNYLVPEGILQFLVVYGFDIMMLIVSHSIVPKWNLNTSFKSIMTAEEKDKQIVKNDYLKGRYKAKEKNKENRFPIFIPIVLSVIVIVFYIYVGQKVWVSIPLRQSNGKNSDAIQIAVLGRKKIYSEASTNSSVLATVRYGDYYDVLNFEELEQNSDLSFYGFAKIKTAKGIEGYLYLGEKGSVSNFELSNKDYRIECSDSNSTCLSKFEYSNKRDEKVDQVEVVTETLKIRKSATKSSEILAVAKEGDIYTILETTKEKVTERVNGEKVEEIRNWYKVKTSNGIEGWMCANVKDDVYLKVLKAK